MDLSSKISVDLEGGISHVLEDGHPGPIEPFSIFLGVNWSIFIPFQCFGKHVMSTVFILQSDHS